MDLFVDVNGGVNENDGVGAKRAKPSIRTSLSDAFDSPSVTKSLNSSTESIYEVVAEFDNEDSDIENINDVENDSRANLNVELNQPDCVNNTNQNGVEVPSDSGEMEEEFVIVDEDASESLEVKNSLPGELPAAKESCDSIATVPEEFSAEKKEITVPQLSDDENEIESALAEFAETEAVGDKKTDSNVILSSDDDEIDGLLEEFRDENSTDDNSSSAKGSTSFKVSQSSKHSVGNDLKTNQNSVLKSLSENKELDSLKRNEAISLDSQQRMDRSTDKVSDANKNEDDCVILVCDNDEKSNGSNISIEIIDDDSCEKDTATNAASCEIKQTSFPKLSSPLKSPSFSSSSEDKFEIDSMLLDIVDESTLEKEEKKNDAELNQTNSESSASTNLFKSFPSGVESGQNKFSAICSTSSSHSEVNAEDTADGEQDEKLKSRDDNSPILNNHENDTPLSSKTINPQDGSHSIVATEKSGDTKQSVSPKADVSSPVNGDMHSPPDTHSSSDAASLMEVSKTSIKDDANELTTSHHVITSGCEEGSSTKNEIDAEKLTVLDVENEASKSADLVQPETDSKSEAIDKSHTNEMSETEDKEKSDCKFEKIPNSVLDGNNSVQVLVKSGELSITKLENANESSVQSAQVSKPTNDAPGLSVDVSNKRKLDECENEISLKKLKEDKEIDTKENTALLKNDKILSNLSNDFALINTSIKDLVSGVSTSETKAVDKGSLLMLFNDPNEKVRVSQRSLDKIALLLTSFMVKRNYQEELVEAENTVKTLEDQKAALTAKLEECHLQVADVRESQRLLFMKHNFRPKAHTRTVGVNVKIYRESEIIQAMSMQNAGKSKTVIPVEMLRKQDKSSLIPKTETAQVLPGAKITTTTVPVIPNLQLKDTVISPVVPNQPLNVRKPLMPRIITQTNRPQVVSQVVTVGSRVPPPNVTVVSTQSGNRFISVGRPPTTHSVMLVPSSSITSTARNQYIDLTKEEQKLQKVISPGFPTPTTVAKGPVPTMANNPNVLVPLKDYLQLLPPGSKGPVIQQSNVQRPALIPPLPSSLLGGRTVTYFVPQNSNIGARGIQPFIQPPNQQVQFVLRVTTPGPTPTLGSVVNTVARPQILQPPLATASRPQLPMTATSSQHAQPQVGRATRSSSGLILFSHTSKHPAPFPKSPVYPDNKGKAVPPKPSLKGNKNSNGIVLSWNMCLFRHHANIASYQLFAYQETDGPVDASLWKKVGDVNALPLPMACTLTQFVDKNRYYFTVRAVDVFQRFGPFSDPVSILYEKESDSTKK